MQIDRKDFMALPDKELSDYPTSVIERYPFTEEEIYDELFDEIIHTLRNQQINLFSEEKQGVVVVLQAMDAAGKDEAVSTVFSNLSAQGIKESELGKPNDVDLQKDYLWRHFQTLPERGGIAVLNRSYYEEVIGTRVHGTLEDAPMPDNWKEGEVWNRRFRHLNEFERYLTENGFKVLKFFLHIDKDVQKDRILERMDDPEKNWDFSFSDVDDRDKWEDFYDAYNDTIKNTSTDYAPWYILPADDAWFTRFLIADILSQTLKDMNPQRPHLNEEEKEKLKKYREKLKQQ